MISGHVLTCNTTLAEIWTVCLQSFLKPELISTAGSSRVSVLLHLNQRQSCPGLFWSTHKPIMKFSMKWWSFCSFDTARKNSVCIWFMQKGLLLYNQLCNFAFGTIQAHK